MIDLASLKWEEQLALRKWVGWVGGWVSGVRSLTLPLQLVDNILF